MAVAGLDVGPELSRDLVGVARDDAVGTDAGRAGSYLVVDRATA